MDNYDSLSIMIGVAAVAPLGILLLFFAWRTRRRTTKWRGYTG
jgi:hypothetical protein